jgi:NAD(P)-dependent dehydrogenase (short-subunit alcohol dehydrogenase family)
MRIQRSVFFISGGSSGLGAACARHLASLGARVVIADVNAPLGKELAKALGPAALFVPTDVTKESDVTTAIDAGLNQFGALAGVINCAGILGAGRVVGREGPYKLDEFAHVIQVNLVGTFNVLRLAAMVMTKNLPGDDGERGVIINTASVAADDGQIGQAAYAASKAGVAGMTLPIARELARFGIRVVAVAPGVFETPMLAALPDEARRSLEAQVPFPQRLGQPGEFAALVAHVVENRMLNGTVLRIDGALRMAAK